MTSVLNDRSKELQHIIRNDVLRSTHPTVQNMREPSAPPEQNIFSWTGCHANDDASRLCPCRLKTGMKNIFQNHVKFTPSLFCVRYLQQTTIALRFRTFPRTQKLVSERANE